MLSHRQIRDLQLFWKMEVVKSIRLCCDKPKEIRLNVSTKKCKLAKKDFLKAKLI